MLCAGDGEPASYNMGISYILAVQGRGNDMGKKLKVFSEVFRSLTSPTKAHSFKTVIIRSSEPYIA